MDYSNIRTGTGGKILPETDPDKRTLAEHVGFVVMMAAQLDVMLSGLVDLATGYESELKMEAWGRSGTDLVGRLRDIEEAFPETAGFAVRYDRLYKIRNQVVHSTRMDGDTDADPDVALRQLKQNPKKPAPGIYEGLVLGVPQLINFWYELRDFHHEAWLIFVDYASRSKWAPKWVLAIPS